MTCNIRVESRRRKRESIEQDIDLAKFTKSDMKGLKRTVKKLGRVLGHRKGINGELIDYLEARKLLYIPSYTYVLKNYLIEEVQQIQKILQEKEVILLDYETNCDPANLSKPLSHASLIATYLNCI